MGARTRTGWAAAAHRQGNPTRLVVEHPLTDEGPDARPRAAARRPWGREHLSWPFRKLQIQELDPLPQGSRESSMCPLPTGDSPRASTRVQNKQESSPQGRQRAFRETTPQQGWGIRVAAGNPPEGAKVMTD